MASWEGFFGGLTTIGQGLVNYNLEKDKQKTARINAATEAKRIENAKFEQETQAKVAIVNAAAQIQREETYYQVAMALAVGVGAALIGAVVAQVLKALKKG